MTLQEQIRSNRLRTGVVLLGFAVLALAFVAVIAGAYDPGIAGVVGMVAIVYGLFSWFAAGRIIAAASGAHPVTKAEQPELYRVLENVAIAAGLTKTPDLYMIDDASPNAFAAGRDPEHAYVAVTTGLLAAARRARARGRAGPRGGAHPQPRRPADEPGRCAGRRDRACLRHADADHHLRRRRPP